VNVDILLWAVVVVLAAAGLAGLVFPLLPGPILLFAGLLLGAWIDDFAYVGTGTLVVLGIFTVLAYLCEILGTAFGAKRFGASRRAVAGAAIGGVVGLFFGLPGVLLGPFLGAVIGELSTRRDLGVAIRAGWGASVGIALAAAGKLALGFTMIWVFLVVRFL
jgi:uncharacterized protein YqgC (DUF456 family)